MKTKQHFYLWVLFAIFIGAMLGHTVPDFAVKLKPLGDGFIALIKMIISPVIFCTVVLGIANAGDMKKVGRVGAKAFLYFEVVSTFALAVGLFVVNILKPGKGFNVDPATLDPAVTSEYVQKASHQSFTDFVLHIIPKTFFDSFTAQGDLLQVLLLALLFGFGMNRMGDKGKAVHLFIESFSHILFSIVGVIMKLAPFGAMGAMAFTVGKYGISSLKPLMGLMGSFYLTCFIFIIGVLGFISWMAGFSVLKFITYIKEEILTVIGTSSSESALIPLMEKLQKLGCSKEVVGLVVPAGYSFNLDGSNIYLTMAALFVAQALNIDLSWGQQFSVLGVAMLTSKGASGVAGSGFITLAATLAIVPDIPVAGLALIVGVDRFMSEARALTNFIGNGVATIVVSKWEKELDLKKLNAELNPIKEDGNIEIMEGTESLEQEC